MQRCAGPSGEADRLKARRQAVLVALLLTVFCLACGPTHPSPGGSVGHPGKMKVASPRRGVVSVQSGRYYLEFDGNAAGGAPNVWYDLLDDPGRTQNLAARGTTSLGYQNGSDYPLLDSWYEATVSGQQIWYHTTGAATLLAVTEQTPEHVTLHTVSPFYAEHPPTQLGPGQLSVDRVWTLYPDGSLFVRQSILVQAPLNHDGFIAWAINPNNLGNFWKAATEQGQADAAWTPAFDGMYGVNGNWTAQYGLGDRASDRGAILLDLTDKDSPAPVQTTRVIIGTGSERASSHLAQRINNGGGIQPGSYSTSAWLRLDRSLNAVPGSGREVSSFGNHLDADYRSPPVTVAAGSLAGSDGGDQLVGGFNPNSGRIVIAAAADHVNCSLQTGGPAAVRLGPRFKVTGWSQGLPTATWGGQALQPGVDYNAYVDSSSGTLYLQLLFDVVAANPGPGQRAAAAFDLS